MRIDEKQTVMGVFAVSAKPNLRGFMMLAILLAAPTGAVLFGVEAVIRWAFQLM